jgi:hypothetical protein
VRKISGCLILLVFSVAACISEVKPLLKPVEVDIATRIANQQKWLDEAIASKELTREQTKPVQVKLYQIKEKYGRLQSAGTIGARDSEEINRMLDESSALLFEIRQKRPKLVH